MIQSMTGFGKSTLSFSHKKITLQLKSLNSKKLDLYTRLPSAYREKELQFHKLISAVLERGKIDFSLVVEEADGAASTKINHAAVKAYIEDLKMLSETGFQDETELVKIAITLPGAFSTEKGQIEEEEYRVVEEGLQEALESLNQYRTDEGQALEKDLKFRVKNLQALLKEVGEIDAQRIKSTRERLQKAVADLKTEVDENRFEQEVVYYIEKLDITEEKTRLSNHLQYFVETMESKESNGKKLGFICQEMGREINTIGSKANDAPMQKLVVQMKDEQGKIKEQILNVL